ncbi:hypothetical protein, partial [Planomicrobium soli]|uniref:hypothetical protein n=1 Tax=Planomicrobium soli TaxID=1176648 RepID=UPI001C62BC05
TACAAIAEICFGVRNASTMFVDVLLFSFQGSCLALSFATTFLIYLIRNVMSTPNFNFDMKIISLVWQH